MATTDNNDSAQRDAAAGETGATSSRRPAGFVAAFGPSEDGSAQAAGSRGRPGESGGCGQHPNQDDDAAGASESNHADDSSLLGSYFQRHGCTRLAWSLLTDCVEQIARDPALKQQSTRAEAAWLAGGDLGGVPASAVFDALGMRNWAHAFAQMAIRQPTQLLRRMSAVRQLAGRNIMRQISTSAQQWERADEHGSDAEARTARSPYLRGCAPEVPPRPRGDRPGLN